MALFNLIARLGLNASGYETSLKRVQSQTHAVGKDIENTFKHHLAAAFGVGAVVIGFERLIHATVEAAKRVKDLSEQFAIDTDEVQRLDIAAKHTGLSFEDFGTALIKVGAARKEAIQGNIDLRQAFSDFGISLDDVNDSGIENIEILKKMGDALQGKEANPRLLQDLRELFGRSGGRLFEALKNIDEFNHGEKILSKEDIEKIHDAELAWDKFVRKMKSTTADVLGAFLTTVGPLQSQRGGEGAFHATPGGPPTADEIALGLAPGGAAAAIAKERGPNIAEDKLKAKELADLAKARLDYENAILKVHFDQLSPAEKYLDLQKRMNEELWIANTFPKNSKEQFEHLTEAEKLRGQLLGFKSRPYQVKADELLQRGGFFGGSNSNAGGTRDELQKMRRLLESIDRKTKPVNALDIGL